MISFLSRSIALFLRDNEIVDEETSQVCQYGFEIIISTLVGFMLVLKGRLDTTILKWIAIGSVKEYSR